MEFRDELMGAFGQLLDDGDIETAMELMRKLVEQAREADGPAPAPSGEGETSGPGDDDIHRDIDVAGGSLETTSDGPAESTGTRNHARKHEVDEPTPTGSEYVSGFDGKARAELDRDIPVEARGMADILESRIQFENADMSGFESGFESGRLVGRDAVRVASMHDEPFSRRCAPEEPARVHIMLAVDVSGSMAEATREGANARIAQTVVEAMRQVFTRYENITMSVSMFSDKAVLVDPEKLDRPSEVYAIGTHAGRDYDCLEQAIEMLRKTPEYLHAYESRDAIVGIVVTDACFNSRTITSSKGLIREPVLASNERWLCILAPGGDAKTVRGIFGAGNFVQVHHLEDSMHAIARSLQTIITDAEASRS